jgi:general secretion pathway protein L
LDQMREASLRVAVAVPDVLALPFMPGHWTILIEGTRTLVRTGTYQGLACESENLTLVLQAMLAELGEEGTPEAIDVYRCSAGLDLRQALLSATIEEHDCAGGALAAMALYLSKTPPINLLQGEFEPEEGARGGMRRWRVAAALLALLLSLEGADKIIEYRRLAQHERALSSDIERILLETFPDMKRVVNPRIQMEQRLKALRGKGGNTGSSYLALLEGYARLAGQAGTVALQTLSYRAGRMDLTITVSDLQALDRLKRSLEEAHIRTEIVSASSEGGKVSGRLRLQAERA